MTTQLVSTCADDLDTAAACLRAGGLVGLPTETVYGLAANAADAEAVARIYAAKGRPNFNPLIAHVADVERAATLIELNTVGRRLADKFWPGPLTLVGPYKGGHAVCDLARAGLDTLAVRVPSHVAAWAVLDRFGGALVAPSANTSGRLSATEAAHVMADLADKIDLVVDGGACPSGLESTIIDVTTERPALLRPGAVATAEIEDLTGPLRRPAVDPDAPKAPGQTLRHYAPNARLRLNATAARSGEALLGFGAMSNATLNLSPRGDLVEAAANLFSMLRALDAEWTAIAVAPIPKSRLGEAMNERLVRAQQSG